MAKPSAEVIKDPEIVKCTPEQEIAFLKAQNQVLATKVNIIAAQEDVKKQEAALHEMLVQYAALLAVDSSKYVFDFSQFAFVLNKTN